MEGGGKRYPAGHQRERGRKTAIKNKEQEITEPKGER